MLSLPTLAVRMLGRGMSREATAGSPWAWLRERESAGISEWIGGQGEEEKRDVF